jgi:hypothetical protein
MPARQHVLQGHLGLGVPVGIQHHLLLLLLINKQLLLLLSYGWNLPPGPNGRTCRTVTGHNRHGLLLDTHDPLLLLQVAR